ncbi:MAG TPA: VCBS repeat-containing protein, partial [Bryobacteraceae bacterium]
MGPRYRHGWAACPARGLLLLLTFSIGAQAQFVTALHSPFAAGTNPQSVVIQDFNGDSWNDIAVADFNNNAVNVLINTHAPGGGFTSTSYPVGHGPTALVLADFNDDTLTDIAVLNSTDHTVTILFGDGEGNFTVDPHGPFPSGPQPTAIGVGDFNGDEQADIAITNFTGTLTVLLGLGSGDFVAASGSPFPVGAGPRGLAVADFNDDLTSDIAVVNSLSNNVTVLRGGMGSPILTPVTGSPFATGANPVAVAVGDFDGDFKPDLAIANKDDGTLTVLLNNAFNSFSPSIAGPIPAGFSPTALTAGFLNGDSFDDIAVTNANGFVTVLYSAQNGEFVPSPNSPFAVGSSPVGVSFGSMRGIDINDITVVNSGSNNVSILFNEVGSGPFGPEIATPILSSAVTADVPDHLNAITAGTNPPGGLINLWIGGYYDVADSFTVTWQDTATSISTDLTGLIQGTTTSLLEVSVPQSLFAGPVSGVDTVNIIITDTTLGLSASAPFLINPPMSAPQLCFQGATQGVPYTQTYVTGGTPPYPIVSYGSGSDQPPGFPGTPTVPMTATATATGNYSFSLTVTDSWNNIFFSNFFNLQVAGIPGIALNPSSVPAGSGDTPLSITGSNLLQPTVFNSCSFAGSQIYWGPFPSGMPLTTSVTGASAASTTIPGALLQSPGTVLVMVQQPGPGGAPSNLQPFMILAPAISGLSPPSINAGAAGFTLTVTGSSYLPGSQIVFGGTPLTTTFGGSGTLTAEVSASQVSTFGPVNVTVVNPGGSTSSVSTFTVMASAISGLIPSSVVAGSAGFTLTVNGPSFVSGSQIFFGATGLTTNFVNGTTLTAPVTAAMVSLAGPVPITVVSPGPFTTPPFTFTVTPAPHPTPTITLPLQSSVLAAAGPTFGNAITSGTAIPGFLLYINGFFNDGFSHTVTWLNTSTNASTAFTTASGIQSVSQTQIVVSIPAALFSALVSGPVTANITVTEQQAIPSPPPPVVSNAAPFLINPPLATTAVTFPDGTVGTAYSQALSFTGGTSPFTSSLFSGTLPPGLSLSSAAGPLAGTPTAPGLFSFAIQIADAWGNTAHASDTLQTVAVPTIVPPLAPASALAGSAALQLTVNGTNFIVPSGAQPGSVLEWIAPGSSPVALPTVVANATQLTATVAASLLASPVTAGIVVLQPNGVASNNVPFSVLGPGISTLSPSSITAGSLGFTLSVSGSNFETGSQILFGGTALGTTFVSSSNLTATVNAPQVAIPGPVNVTVVNPGSVPSAAAIFTVMVNPFPTPSITPPLQSSLLTSTTPNLGHGITGGANLTGFKLYIAGNFDAGDNTTVTWMNTGTSVSTTFTTDTGIQSITPTQIVVIVPSSLFSQTLVIQQTVNVTVTQQEPIASPPPPVTSNAAPFFINPKPNTNITIFPPGTPGVPFSFTGPIVGGSPPFTFTVFSGTLPPGLTLTPDSGVLSGTPTVPGDYSFGIEVTDVWGDTVDVQEYMQVAGPPSITVGIAPSSVPAGTPGVQATINGNGFLAPASAGSGVLPGTVAEWLTPGASPVALATTVTSDSLATAVIPANLLVSPLNAQIVMMQPSGLTSNPMPFTVLPPVLSGLLPASATAGSASFTLTASGANFLNGSQISFAGTPLATAFLGSGTLSAPVSAALVSKAGVYSVTVTNPGGAISAAVAFPVLSKITILTASLPPAQTGVLYDVVLAATGGTLPYTWSATGLPASVTVNPATGEIRGAWNT